MSIENNGAVNPTENQDRNVNHDDPLRALFQPDQNAHDEIEERVKSYLRPKTFERWKRERRSSWGKAVASVPFGKYNKPDTDISKACEVFDRTIVGRDEEKSEMLRKIATFSATGKFRRPILLVGNPGEGKSCFAKCLADAIGYPIRYINVPSIHSPIALCGSEQHYSNTRIGGLIQAVTEEETLSVVFVFDEIDKTVNNSTDGSVEAVLLALFDPMWNGQFTDRSLDVPVDLSHCVFICTANELSSISEPLIDRLDIIRFDPYTSEEVQNILEQVTVPKGIEECGMTGKIRFNPEVIPAIVDLIDGGSMRDYEKIVEKLIDNAIFMLLKNKRKRYTVTPDDLDVILHSEKRKQMGFSA